MIPAKFSPTMQDAISYANEHGGKLARYPGGFWCRGGLKTYEHPWFGTTTIEALVNRGVARYTQWHEGQRARFPIEVTMISLGCASHGFKFRENCDACGAGNVTG